MCLDTESGAMVVSSGDADDRTRLRHASECEEVGVQLIGVREEECVRGVSVHPQRAPSQQSSRLVPAEPERRLDIAVTVHDQCRNVEGSQLITEVAGEAGQEELDRRTR